MNGENTLKACAHCGETAIGSSYITGMVSLWRVWCSTCGVKVEARCEPFDKQAEAEARQKAETLWNTRASGWQDIETAPKIHGHMILSTNRYGALAFICWNDNAVFHEDTAKPPSERFTWSGAWDDGERGDDLDEGAFVPFEPKVWMPAPDLPTPPHADSDKGGER